jgi:hypothetical protein
LHLGALRRNSETMRKYAAPLCLLLVGVMAGPAARAQTAPELHLAYDTYAAGLNVLKLTAALKLTASAYQVDLDYRTAGIFGALFSSEMHDTATGTWAGYVAEPLRFYSHGQFRGDPRRTLIDYLDGQPRLRILEPPPAEQREPVPPGMERNAVDALSAMAQLIRAFGATGHCAGHASLFDGHRLSEITVRDDGDETLTRTSGTMFGGPTHRCAFEGRQTAGFVRDADRAELNRPHRGVAWLARLAPGEPAVPVRLTFETRYFGDATMYLVDAGYQPDAGRAPGTAGR